MKNVEERIAEAMKERVLFSGAPTKKPYPVVQTILLAAVFIAICVTDGFLMGASVFKSISGEKIAVQVALAVVAFCLHVVPLCVWAYALTKSFFAANTTRYFITEKSASIIVDSFVKNTRTADLFEISRSELKKDTMILYLKEDKMVFKNLPDAKKIYDAVFKITKK